MFKKKIDIDILNMFNKIENKIDTINSKFNSITYLDGCCQCKERELKINEMFINFFDSKIQQLRQSDDTCLLEFKEMLRQELQNIPIQDNKSELNKLRDELRNIQNVQRSLLDEYAFDIKDNVVQIQKDIIELRNNDQVHLDKQLRNIQNVQRSLLDEYALGVKDNVVQIQKDIIELRNNDQVHLDKQLRFDLNTLLVNIKDEVKNDIKMSLQITVQNQNQLMENLLNVKDTTSNIFNKTDAFAYDNEIIKHQFILEENIRVSNDTIDVLKLSINKSINEIDNIIIKLQ